LVEEIDELFAGQASSSTKESAAKPVEVAAAASLPKPKKLKKKEQEALDDVLKAIDRSSKHKHKH
jgi:hypothetical protein